MAPMIALAVSVMICLVLFPREISKRHLNPLIIALLVICLLMLMHGGGSTVQLGPSLWSNHWLPKMLGIIIVFLIMVIPGPKLMAIIKDIKDNSSNSYKALTSAVIGILTCVLVSLIAITVASRGVVTPLFLNW